VLVAKAGTGSSRHHGTGIAVAREAACRKAVCRAAPASSHTSSGFRQARQARLPQRGPRKNGACVCNIWPRRGRVEHNPGRQGHLLQALAPQGCNRSLTRMIVPGTAAGQQGSHETRHHGPSCAKYQLVLSHDGYFKFDVVSLQQFDNLEMLRVAQQSAERVSCWFLVWI
jgi:hypothetical protein